MSRPLRIAMVAACPFPWPRGTPIRIHQIAEALAARGHEIHVVTYHHGETTDAPMRIHRIRNISSYKKYSPGPTYRKLLQLDPLLARRLVGVLRDYDIDVIHAHHYEGLLVAACGRFFTGHPIVYDAHTLLESELPSYGLGLPRGMKREVGKMLDHHVPQWSDHMIAVTERIRRRILENGKVDPERVTVISNGVEYDRFEHCSWPTGKGDGPRKVIFTGNLAAYQGIDLMLDAFARAGRVLRDVRLRLVTGSSFEEHEERARQLGIRERIDVVPADFDTLPGEMEHATVALNPRVWCDGIPQKLLNYMAAGRAIVSFEGSAPCVEHGRTGWVVPAGNSAAFAEGIVTLLEDDAFARRLGDAAREHVRVNHTWDETAMRVEVIYERVLRERSS